MCSSPMPQVKESSEGSTDGDEREQLVGHGGLDDEIEMVEVDMRQNMIRRRSK